MCTTRGAVKKEEENDEAIPGNGAQAYLTQMHFVHDYERFCLAFVSVVQLAKVCNQDWNLQKPSSSRGALLLPLWTCVFECVCV